MDRRAFENLRVLRREHAARVGDAEVCRGQDGLDRIRLRIWDGACQRDCLKGGLPACARLEGGALELLYPFGSGESLREWLFARDPGLGERRDACLTLLAQCMEDAPPPCVLALSACEENLRFSKRGARLLYLPDWGAWQEGLTQSDAVQAAARLCREVLTRDAPWHSGRLLPMELRLVLLRTRTDGYRSWGALQRDLAALPDAPPTLEGTAGKVLRGLRNVLRRLQKPLFCALTAAAVLLALLSLAAEALRRRDVKPEPWPGMTGAAGQEWGEEP